MFLQHITHINRRPLYLPPFMIFFAGAASQMSHQALCHMNKPWTPIPSRSHGKSSPHACRRAHAKWKQSDNNSKTLLEWWLYLQILYSFAFKTSQPARSVSTAWCFLQHRFVKWLLFRAHTHFIVIQCDTAAVFHSVGSSGGALRKRTHVSSLTGAGGWTEVPEQTLNPRPSNFWNAMLACRFIHDYLGIQKEKNYWVLKKLKLKVGLCKNRMRKIILDEMHFFLDYKLN